MGRPVLLLKFILGVLLTSGIECQEFVTLSLPSRAPFVLHPTEDLTMDLSEVRPIFLYASSQNDFVHQNLPQHSAVSHPARQQHQQVNRPRPQIIETPSHQAQNQRHNNLRSTPPLTYGFQPKTPSNRPTQSHQRPKKFHTQQQKNTHNERSRNSQEPVYQPAIRLENQQQHNHYAENIQVQASVQKQQNVDSHSNVNFQNGHIDLSSLFNLHTQHFDHPETFVTQLTEHRRPNENNQDFRNHHKNVHIKEEHKKQTFKNQNPHIILEHENNNPHARDRNKNPHLRREHQNQNTRTRDQHKNQNSHIRNEHKSQNPNIRNEQKNQNSQIRNEQKNKNPHMRDERRNLNPHLRDEHRNQNPHLRDEHKIQNPNIRNEHKNQNPHMRDEHKNQNPHMREEHKNQNPHVRDEHRQESVRKHSTFQDSVQAFKSRNVPNNGNKFPPTLQHSFSRERVQDRNHQNNHERLNLQHHARSMRGENKPQLPPRPHFNNGGIRINTLAGELPVLHLDSLNVNENPAVYPRNGDHPNQASDEQEKKTYLLIKAPNLETTEGPTSAPFVIENLQHVSPPYILNNLAETTVHIPEIRTTTAELNTEAPAIVLDLVQIPDYSLYSHQEKTVARPIPSPEYRSADKDRNFVDHFQPTESYPTTPHRFYEDVVHKSTHSYTPVAEDVPKYSYTPVAKDVPEYSYTPVAEDVPKYQNKVIPKPKIKELKKAINISLDHPISYSSSVSVVSVKQNVEAKQSTPKKQKATLKKGTSHKKKPKVPENGDYVDDGYYGNQDIPGEAGIDYPTYKDIPETNFDCKTIESPGFYADLEAGCQVFHNCDTSMVKHSFMCPNGTIFHQELFICDWWYNVKCEDAHEFYSLNSGLFINDANNDFKRKA